MKVHCLKQSRSLGSTPTVLTRLMSISVAFNLAFPFGLSSQKSDAIEGARAKAEPPLSINLKCEAPGRAPLFLEPIPDGGYVIRFDTDSLRFGFPCMLVSIDKKNLRDFSLKQLDQLLKGPVGSSVVLDFMMEDGKSKSTTVTREALKNDPLWDSDAIGISYSNYDNRIADWNGAFVENSFDLQARASQNLVLREAKEWPSESREEFGTAAIAAALTNYEVGNIAEGDMDLTLALKAYRAGDNWRLTQNRQCTKSIKTLISVGRLNEANKLLEILQGSPRPDLGDAFIASLEVARAQLKTDKAAALAKLDKLATSSNNSRGSTRNFAALPKLYEQANEYKKAIENYESMLKNMAAWSGQWAGVLEASGILMHEACLKDKLGDKPAAMMLLQQAIDKMSAIPVDQQTNLEKMPGIFPRLSGAKSALSDLQNGKPFPAIAASPADAGESDSDFPDIRACHEAITKNDKVTATRLIRSFLKQYQGHVPQALKSSGRQNLYCSILTLAREMTNKGWTKLSDSVLQSLRQNAEGKDNSEMAKAFLQFEIVYNTIKLHGDTAAEWNQLDSLWHVAPSPKKQRSSRYKIEREESAFSEPSVRKDYAFSMRLRILAMIYYYAGELDRATEIMQQALMVNDSERGKPAPNVVGDTGDNESQRILMLLDSACLAAQTKQFEKANALWEQLKKLVIIKGDAYPKTVIELCSIYSQCNRSDKAITMLKEVRARSNEFRTKFIDNGYTALDFMLVKLLMAAGNIKEAKVIADQSAAQMPQRLGWPDCLLVARCAELEGDFAQAATYYAMGPWTSHPFAFVTEDTENYTEKALACAQKAPTFDKKAFSNLYVQVADYKSMQERKDSSDLYKHAIELLPDSDPQKSLLMRKLENQRVYAKANIPNLPTADEKIPHTLSNQTKTNFSSAAVEKRLNSDSDAHQRATAHINQLLLIAGFAERNHHPNARAEWVNLACAEIYEGNWQKGLEYAYHVMDLYSALDIKNHIGVLGEREDIVNALAREHIAETEKLLLAAVDKTQAMAGFKNVATEAQLAELFTFYVNQKKFAEASPVLDRILTFDLKTGETLSQALTHSHCGSWPQAADTTEVLSKIYSSISNLRDSNMSFAQQSLAKILTAQEKVLKPDDERLMPTLAQLGDVSFDMHKYIVADNYYSQALAISMQYHKGEFAVRQVGKHFIENLKKIGRVSEANKFSDAGWEGVRK